MLYHRATASTLAITRIWVFLLWTAYVATDPIESLAGLPREVFTPPGFLRVIRSFWSVFVTDDILRAFRLLLFLSSACCAFGVVPKRKFYALTALILVIYQGFLRGFAGHMNHDELCLLYATVIVTVFPSWEDLVAFQTKSPPDPAPRHRAPCILIVAVLCLTYALVAVVRLGKGSVPFTSDVIQVMILRQWCTTGAVADGVYLLPTTLPVGAYMVPAWLLRLLFVLATFLELSAPLCIFFTGFRRMFVIAMLLFHTGVWVFAGVAFPENMCLLALLYDDKVTDWGERLSARWRRIRGLEPRPD